MCRLTVPKLDLICFTVASGQGRHFRKDPQKNTLTGKIRPSTTTTPFDCKAGLIIVISSLDVCVYIWVGVSCKSAYGGTGMDKSERMACLLASPNQSLVSKPEGEIKRPH